MAAALFGVSARLHSGSLTAADYREAIVTTQRPLSLDPLVGRDDPAVRELGHLLYRGLLRLDDHAMPVPDLAASYTLSSDGLSSHLVLNSGRKWSDGTPISGSDVVASEAFAASPLETDSVLRAGFQGVKVQAHGGTIDFTLSAPRAAFAATLSDLPVLPSAQLADQSTVTDTAVQPRPTSGAYVVSSSGPSGIRLEINPHAALPPAMRVVVLLLYSDFTTALAALRSGDVDGLLARTPGERQALQGVAGLGMHDSATFRFVDVIFNQRTPGLSDAAVRTAMNLGVDRPRLVSGPLAGAAVAQSNAVPAGITWAAPTGSVSGPNIEAANAALDAAGWRRGADHIRARGSVRLAFTVSVPDVAPIPVVAAELVSQMATIGIELKVAAIPEPDFRSHVIEPHAFEIAIADWDNGADPDISEYWRSSAIPPIGYNVGGGAVDAFLDANLDSLATINDASARQQALQRVVTQIGDDAPAIFLYAPTVTLAVSNSFRGVVVAPTGGGAAALVGLPSWQRG